jgi:hypothetical protein
MIEGSGAESGSVYLTNKSGSRGPKTYESYGSGFGSATTGKNRIVPIARGTKPKPNYRYPLSTINISTIKM